MNCIIAADVFTMVHTRRWETVSHYASNLPSHPRGVPEHIPGTRADADGAEKQENDVTMVCVRVETQAWGSSGPR